MCDELRMANHHIERKNRNASTRVARALAALALACALAGGGSTVLADDGGANVRTPAAGAAAGPQVDNPDYWVGRNITAVVKVFGQPTYWNANHEGGGGGNRYIYSNPNQPHFVFETAPGEMIVRAVRIP